MIWQAEGTPFDELTRAIERFDVLFTAAEQQVMDAVAAELGQVTTAAAPPPSEEIPEPVPVEPGEAAVSLDTLAMIATLWAAVVASELMPALSLEYLAGAFNLAESARPALDSKKSRDNLPDDAEPPTPENILGTVTAEDYLAAARNRMVRFSDVLWDVARAQLLEGFMEGEGIAELRDRLRSVPGITAARAATVARTEVVSASNAGSISMVRVYGFDGHKVWIATEDERTRETHSNGPIGADGQRVSLSEAFVVGGFPLDFPGDPSGPPQEIINCRCSLHYELSDGDDEPMTAGGNMAGEWIGVLALEGVPTGDVPRRMFMPGVLSSAELPLPLLWQRVSADGHDGSVIVGNIEDVSRMGELIPGKGRFDLGGPDGIEAHRMVREGFLRGISIDADNFEPSDVEYIYGPGPIDPAGGDGPSVVMTVFHAGRLRGATLCAIPAFAEARISLMSDTTDALAESEVEMVASAAPAVVEPETLPALTAAAYVLTIPDVPPAEWFAEPTDVEIKGALTVTDEGRVYGYLAPAGVDHRSFAKSVRVPMGNVDYSLFMGRETIVAGGGRVVTGALTMDCGHASTGHRDPSAALDHYDNACSIVATVSIGENAKGVWVAGALVPGVEPSQIVRMMACQLSGDWRPHRQRNGWREFAGALLVPVPGFAMTRTEASVLTADGEPVEVNFAEFGNRVRFAESEAGELELVASAVPVEFVHTEKDCGCDKPPTTKPKPNFSFAVQALAESLGLDKKTRLTQLRNMVNETRR